MQLNLKIQSLQIVVYESRDKKINKITGSSSANLVFMNLVTTTFVNTIDETKHILRNKRIDLLITFTMNNNFIELISIIKDRETRLLLIDNVNDFRGVSILNGDRKSSWHAAIPYEHEELCI